MKNLRTKVSLSDYLTEIRSNIIVETRFKVGINVHEAVDAIISSIWICLRYDN